MHNVVKKFRACDNVFYAYTTQPSESSDNFSILSTDKSQSESKQHLID